MSLEKELILENKRLNNEFKQERNAIIKKRLKNIFLAPFRKIKKLLSNIKQKRAIKKVQKINEKNWLATQSVRMSKIMAFYDKAKIKTIEEFNSLGGQDYDISVIHTPYGPFVREKIGCNTFSNENASEIRYSGFIKCKNKKGKSELVYVSVSKTEQPDAELESENFATYNGVRKTLKSKMTSLDANKKFAPGACAKALFEKMEKLFNLAFNKLKGNEIDTEL